MQESTLHEAVYCVYAEQWSFSLQIRLITSKLGAAVFSFHEKLRVDMVFMLGWISDPSMP